MKTLQVVKFICDQLGIKDWTKLSNMSEIDPGEAQIILKTINPPFRVPIQEFQKGLKVELEHGLMHEETNVTNNDPIATGKIALVHLFESLDYYKLLEKMEEGFSNNKESTEIGATEIAIGGML